MRYSWLLLALVGTALLAGCAQQNQTNDASQRRLAATQTELDEATRALRDARARNVALETELASERRKDTATRADNSRLKDRLDSLSKNYAEYRATIEQRAQAPLSRPEVSATPLPSAIDEALQAFADKYSGRVWYDRARGAVSFANDRLFETGSDEVRTDAYAALGDLAVIAARSSAERYEVIVVGHTDDAPITRPETLAKHPSNWHLSVHRAIAVKSVLVSAGLARSRIGIMGYGSNRPIGNDRARNRRVEVFIVRKGEVGAMTPVKPT